MTTLSLAGKTVLVTGAARRIGRALALACARSGASIVIHYGRSEISAQQLQAEISGIGSQAWIFQADLQDPGEAARLIEQAASLRPLDALVNNASIFGPASLEETSLSDWQSHLA